MTTEEKVAKWCNEYYGTIPWDDMTDSQRETWLREANELLSLIDQQGEPPEDDWDNEDYMRGWQDGKQDSVDPRSKTPCPGCARGDEPVLLDEDGTRCSISGNPGRLGHGVDDRFWFCGDHAPPDQQGEPVGWLSTFGDESNYYEFIHQKYHRAEAYLAELRTASYTVEPLYLHPPASREREALLRLRTEVNCRIEHGAESGGHLEFVQEQLDAMLAGNKTIDSGPGRGE